MQSEAILVFKIGGTHLYKISTVVKRLENTYVQVLIY